MTEIVIYVAIDIHWKHDWLHTTRHQLWDEVFFCLWLFFLRVIFFGVLPST